MALIEPPRTLGPAKGSDIAYDNAAVLKEEVLRAFILSQSLEPLAEKEGCTTRHVDSSPGTKLEYFLISAVNSVSPILDLVDEVIANGAQPPCVFEFGYRAQAKSPRNRLGGKVNYAQILMLVPIITAQCLLFVEGGSPGDVDAVLDRVASAMQHTTTADVVALQKLVDLSRELSQRHHARLGSTRQQLTPRFVGNYSNIAEAVLAPDFAHTMMATEIRDGYPVCRRVYEQLRARGELSLIAQSEFVYKDLVREVTRHDIAADCIVVGFYLILIGGGMEILFP
jgi:hypothetical protein